MDTTSQVSLNQSQIEAFYVNCFNQSQVDHFSDLMSKLPVDDKYVVDMGGGVGYFARHLNSICGYRIRVVDSNAPSIGIVNEFGDPNIQGVVGDALNPDIKGDEGVICFNLILHHLVGRSETETRALQKNALLAWRGSSVPVFVNEYIYDSLIFGFSGRIIFEITSNTYLSVIASFVSKFIPSLRANTFGVGVRFRSSSEWISLFEECGFDVLGVRRGDSEFVSFFRRLLLIKEIRRDSFLLVERI